MHVLALCVCTVYRVCSNEVFAKSESKSTFPCESINWVSLSPINLIDFRFNEFCYRKIAHKYRLILAEKISFKIIWFYFAQFAKSRNRMHTTHTHTHITHRRQSNKPIRLIRINAVNPHNAMKFVKSLSFARWVRQWNKNCSMKYAWAPPCPFDIVPTHLHTYTICITVDTENINQLMAWWKTSNDFKYKSKDGNK